MDKASKYVAVDEILLQELAFHFHCKDTIELKKVRGYVDKMLGRDAVLARTLKYLVQYHDLCPGKADETFKGRENFHQLCPKWLIVANEEKGLTFKNQLDPMEILRVIHANNTRSKTFSHLLFPTPNRKARYCLFTNTITAHAWTRFLNEKGVQRVKEMVLDQFPDEKEKKAFENSKFMAF